ncbi:hypothetical protein [Paenibacillus hamazuiensis]|nr:hypothetical protein [Paenibacillus hamazuiensis]
MNEQLEGIELFLDNIHKIERQVFQLIEKSNLTEREKQFILEHILIVPGK